MTKAQIKNINEAVDNDCYLNGWEYDFIYALADYNADRVLTESEDAKLTEIVTKINDRW